MTVSLKDITLQKECRRRVSSYMETHILATYWEAETADELHFLVVQRAVKILSVCLAGCLVKHGALKYPSLRYVRFIQFIQIMHVITNL